MRPVDWKELKALCESQGCLFDRQKGDHYIMTKPGMARPVVIPRKKSLKENIVLSVGRTLGLKRSEMLSLLDGKKKGK